jgi:uncharacterized FAD-dependent dehydrogenase
MGFRPIILERGKEVRERTKDTFGLWRKSVLNPESNVQFGEGGAGTFSDGKLYSQIKDPKHYGRKVLTSSSRPARRRTSCTRRAAHRHVPPGQHGREDARRDAGTGREIRFETRVDDIDIDNGQVRGLKLSNGDYLPCDHVILAVGHSARDTFQMLHDRGVFMEAKPFSLGFRIEHPQGLINRSRFGKFAGNKLLGAADYKVVHHASNGRAVYSFCMCPGGTVVAAASEPGRLVTNGMSQYYRAERNANAGIVVGITPDEDFPGGRWPASHSSAVGRARVRAGRQRLSRAGPTGRRLHRRACLDGARLGRAVVQAGRDADRPEHGAAGLRDRRDPRSAARTRQEDRRVCDARCGADRRGDAHVVAAADSPQPRRLSEHQRAWPVSGRRRRGLCGGIYSAAIDGIEVAEAVALHIANGQ